MSVRVFQLLAATLVAASILPVTRRIRRIDPLAGLIVQLGVLLRLGAGAALFWISYLDLPILRGLHSGDGLWEPDARSYFHAAVTAMREGLGSVGDWSASPAYVKTLAVWMHLVGISPASGVLLNLVSYVGVCGLLVAVLTRTGGTLERRSRLLALACITFSPGLILFGAEPLKDSFFTLCVAVASVAALAWLVPAASGRLGREPVRAATGLIVMCGATYLIAGMRAYVSFLSIAAVFAVAALWLWRQPVRAAVQGLMFAAAAVALLWISFAYGAGAYYPYYAAKVEAVLHIAPGVQPVAAIDAAREGFVRSGGGTNIVRREAHEGSGTLALLTNRAVNLAVGFAAALIPVTVLKWLSIVDVSGGRGLLIVTDVDTLFVDLTCALVIWFVLRERARLRPGHIYLIYGGMIAAVTTVLMAYVVTNLGTLFRIRLIPATLVWMLPIAAAARQPAERISVDAAAAAEKEGGDSPRVEAGVRVSP